MAKQDQCSVDHQAEPSYSLGQHCLLGLIRLYQLTLSPWIGRQCRFYPTCSHYAREAVVVHGAAKGSWYALRRLGKCHPFHKGGVDMVPNPVPTIGHKH